MNSKSDNFITLVKQLPTNYYKADESTKKHISYYIEHKDKYLNDDALNVWQAYQKGFILNLKKIIKSSPALYSTYKLIVKCKNKTNLNEIVRSNTDVTVLSKLINTYFTGSNEGWFSGLDNFIQFSKNCK